MSQSIRAVSMTALLLFSFFSGQPDVLAEVKKESKTSSPVQPCFNCQAKDCTATAATWKQLFRKIFPTENNKENLNKGEEK